MFSFTISLLIYYVVIGLFSACRYLWRKLTALLMSSSQTLNYLIQVLLLAWFGVVLVTIPLSHVYVYSEPLLLLKMGNFLIGVVLFLTGTLLSVSATSYILGKLFNWRNNTKGFSNTQTLIGLLLTLIVCTWGSLRAGSLHVEYVNIPIKNLPTGLNGTTMVQLSDIHLGPFIGKSRMEYLVERVNELHGDIVVITGDLADANVASLWEAVKPLEKVTSKYGIYYCTGEWCILVSYELVH